MSTVGELIQKIQFGYNSRIQKDRFHLRNRLIYKTLLSNKNLLMFQKINKKQSLQSYYYKTLPCIKLEKAPLYDCPCIPPAGCTFLRSEYQLPEIVGGLSSSVDLLVTSLDGNIKFTYISQDRIKYVTASKYSANINYFLIINKYLYILSKDIGRTVAVTGPFEDFIEVENYIGLCKDCVDCNQCLDIMDVVFPISKELEPALIKMTIDELADSKKVVNEHKE